MTQYPTTLYLIGKGFDLLHKVKSGLFYVQGLSQEAR